MCNGFWNKEKDLCSMKIQTIIQMKKTITFLLVAFILSLFVPTLSYAINEKKVEETTSVVPAEAQKLISRLEEIKAMDKTTLTKPEKRKLRKEVRKINKNLRVVNGGIYVSVGAIILVALLLVILL